MLNVIEFIVVAAQLYVGQKETTANLSFVDKNFLDKMKQRGWYSGLAWCAFFAELVWLEAFQKVSPVIAKELEPLFSGSALKTFQNFSEKYPAQVSKTPEVGALVVWQFGNGASGHIGVVIAVDEKGNFRSVEGNTNAEGGREGNVVAVKSRKTHYVRTSNGLNLKGFIKPIVKA